MRFSACPLRAFRGRDHISRARSHLQQGELDEAREWALAELHEDPAFQVLVRN